MRNDMAEEQLSTNDKVINLFKFLKGFSGVGRKAIVNINNQNWVYDLDDLREINEFVEVIYQDTESAEDTDYLLKITKPDIFPPCPKPDHSFVNWLKSGWNNYKKVVTLIDKSPEKLSDDSERLKKYKSWMDERNKWVSRMRILDKANTFFSTMYHHMIELDRDSETIEMMVGNGFVVSKSDSTIKHPILLRKVYITFDADRNILYVKDSGENSEIYTVPFQNISDVHLDKIQHELNENQQHPLDCSGLEKYLTRILHLMSSKSHYEESESRVSFGADELVAYNKPVIFIRKKLSGVVESIEKIIENIEETEYIPQFLENIVSGGMNEVPEDTRELTIEERLAETGGEDPQILLSKPANKEQLEIARRIENYPAVLVQGPPGTGKTHTIANLTGNFLAEGKSVLITSYTKKALTVLKDKLDPGIQNLCVAVLDDTNKDLERSVAGITEYMSSHNSHEMKEKVEKETNNREEIIKELSKTRKKLYDIKYTECNTIDLNGESISPTKAAKFVNENEDTLSYIPGTVKEWVPMPITIEEATHLYSSNGEISVTDEEEMAFDIPDSEELITPEQLQENYAHIDEINKKIDEIEKRQFWKLDLDQSNSTVHFTTETIEFDYNFEENDTENELANYIEQLPSFTPWLIRAVVDGAKGDSYASRWKKLIEQLQTTEALKVSLVEKNFDNKVEIIDEDAALNILDVYQRMKNQFRDKGTLKSFLRGIPKDYQEALKYIRVNEHELASADDCDLAIMQLQLVQNRRKCSDYWQFLMKNDMKDFFSLDPEEPESIALNFKDQIERALSWYENETEDVTLLMNKNDIPEEIFGITTLDNKQTILEKKIKGLKEIVPDILEISSLMRTQKQYNEAINETYMVLDKGSRKNSTLCKNAKSAMINRDLDTYAINYQKIAKLHHKYEIQHLREELLKKVELYAPEWADDISHRRGIHGETTPPKHLLEAWKWKQLDEILVDLNKESLEELQEKCEKLSAEYRRSTAKLAELKAWYYLLLKTEGDISLRQSLQGWVKTVKKIGKGTGKRAARFRAEAKKQMASCQNAVPAWIMPISKSFETLDPKKNHFDVLIIDEASQANLSALALTYLADKVVVVGDDKQVSPLSVGTRVEQITSLQDMYIKDNIPNAQLYNETTSLYDIAETTFPSLMLQEHFRCVPEIIGYSNMLSYDGKIKPLRDGSDNKLLPAVINYRVHDGERNPIGKTNEQEAKSIVALLIACLRQPEYKGKTFGVISLLGTDQAKLISQLLDARLPINEISKRQIICGDSANFQGDERDVIFLSMVDSNNNEGPLRLLGPGNQDSTKKRYNVAVSRAKDQIWVVNSLDASNDLKESDLRKGLLNYASDPSAYNTKMQKIEEESESPFEEEVAKALVSRGYHIYQQWKVGSYRLDIVAEYRKNRIAIECDGERFHSGEQKIREDMERQTILERIGWRFIRIRGSKYYRNKEKTIEDIIDQLNDRGIYPESSNYQNVDQNNTDLFERVKTYASHLLEKFNDEDAISEYEDVSIIQPKTVNSRNIEIDISEKIKKFKEDINKESLINKLKLSGKVNEHVMIEDLKKFCMYLSCSDGQLSPDEAVYISKLTGQNIDTYSIESEVEELDLYSHKFESTPPKVLENLVENNNAIHKNKMDDLIQTVLKLFETVGNEFINSDGSVEGDEIDDLNTYLTMMSDYVEKNKKTHKDEKIQIKFKKH